MDLTIYILVQTESSKRETQVVLSTAHLSEVVSEFERLFTHYEKRGEQVKLNLKSINKSFTVDYGDNESLTYTILKI